MLLYTCEVIMVDLHTHTTYSSGYKTIKELLIEA